MNSSQITQLEILQNQLRFQNEDFYVPASEMRKIDRNRMNKSFSHNNNEDIIVAERVKDIQRRNMNRNLLDQDIKMAQSVTIQPQNHWNENQIYYDRNQGQYFNANHLSVPQYPIQNVQNHYMGQQIPYYNHYYHQNQVQSQMIPNYHQNFLNFPHSKQELIQASMYDPGYSPHMHAQYAKQNFNRMDRSYTVSKNIKYDDGNPIHTVKFSNLDDYEIETKKYDFKAGKRINIDKLANHDQDTEQLNKNDTQKKVETQQKQQQEVEEFIIDKKGQQLSSIKTKSNQNHKDLFNIQLNNKEIGEFEFNTPEKAQKRENQANQTIMTSEIKENKKLIRIMDNQQSEFKEIQKQLKVNPDQDPDPELDPQEEKDMEAIDQKLPVLFRGTSFGPALQQQQKKGTKVNNFHKNIQNLNPKMDISGQGSEKEKEKDLNDSTGRISPNFGKPTQTEKSGPTQDSDKNKQLNQSDSQHQIKMIENCKQTEYQNDNELQQSNNQQNLQENIHLSPYINDKKQQELIILRQLFEENFSPKLIDPQQFYENLLINPFQNL